MTKTASFLLFFVLSTQAFSQAVLFQRDGNLVKTGYNIIGIVSLKSFSNNTLSLSFSDDFETMAGPDVRVFLSKSTSIVGAKEIANLASLKHFKGSISFDVSADINEYNYVLLHCVQFNVSWANATLGVSKYVCSPSVTATDKWVTEKNICNTDGNSDVINLLNNNLILAGNNYAFVITDTNETIRKIVYSNSYDFEGSESIPERVYGVSFAGTLSATIGTKRNTISATECFINSKPDLYLTVTKNACALGIENNESNNSTLFYPNPASSILSFKSKQNSVAIFDLAGNKVIESFSTSEIDVANIKNGIYFIDLDNALFKLVIKH